ncbi:MULTISPECIES: hypothetical protein [Rhizobium]|uniref:Uncharacterized protein n=1 Tax=Rhizobium paranaense TaxID=1650438 RepID=A0A7W8XQP3_9HYPH|nr:MULTISPECIES: hypothetical protein [Rhizobium]MBB5573731.1 hypothetical protein [Rhizobium paranaense]PST61530.1 hypothetical protein C9E91_19200 [Rhizobium sp. SEMIA4064]
MFFMGGMTMGYLHPPQPAKEEDALAVTLPEEKSRRQIGPTEAAAPEPEVSAVERTLIWARRILC